MSEDLARDIDFLDKRDDAHVPTALLAHENVKLKHPFQQRCPVEPAFARDRKKEKASCATRDPGF